MFSTTTMEMIISMKSGKNTVPSPTETENSVLCVGKGHGRSDFVGAFGIFC